MSAVQPQVKPARYTVATMGFDRGERRALQGVLGLSEQCTARFSSFVAAPHEHPDIVIVNGDAPRAVQHWSRFEHSAQWKNVCPVFLTRNPDALQVRYVLGRPALATLLLTLLEHVVTENHGFVPPIDRVVRDPVVLLSPGEVAALTQSGVTTMPNGHTPEPMRVLAIVDSLTLRIQMKRALAKIGAHVDFAGSGGRAFQRIETHCYASIFLDGGLAGEDAYDI
jgi:hypothetical protein